MNNTTLDFFAWWTALDAVLTDRGIAQGHKERAATYAVAKLLYLTGATVTAAADIYNTGRIYQASKRTRRETHAPFIDMAKKVTVLVEEIDTLQQRVEGAEATNGILRDEVERLVNERLTTQIALWSWNYLDERRRQVITDLEGERLTLRENIEKVQEDARLLNYNLSQDNEILRHEINNMRANDEDCLHEKTRRDLRALDMEHQLQMSRVARERADTALGRVTNDLEIKQRHISKAILARLEGPDVIDSDSLTKADVKALVAAVKNMDAILREGSVPSTFRGVVPPASDVGGNQTDYILGLVAKQANGEEVTAEDVSTIGVASDINLVDAALADMTIRLTNCDGDNLVGFVMPE